MHKTEEEREVKSERKLNKKGISETEIHNNESSIMESSLNKIGNIK